MTRRRRPPEALSALVPRVLHDLGLDAPARAARLAEHWGEAVGEEIARASEPVALRGETLEVEVRTSVWCQQLSLRAPEILDSLRRVAGADAPTALRFRVGSEKG